MYSNTSIGMFTPIFQRTLRQLVSTGLRTILGHLNSSLPGPAGPTLRIQWCNSQAQESQHKEAWAHTDKLGQYVSRTLWPSNHSGVRKWERQGVCPDHSVVKDRCSWEYSEDALPASYRQRIGLSRDYSYLHSHGHQPAREIKLNAW